MYLRNNGIDDIYIVLVIVLKLNIGFCLFLALAVEVGCNIGHAFTTSTHADVGPLDPVAVPTTNRVSYPNGHAYPGVLLSAAPVHDSALLSLGAEKHNRKRMNIG